MKQCPSFCQARVSGGYRGHPRLWHRILHLHEEHCLAPRRLGPVAAVRLWSPRSPLGARVTNSGCKRCNFMKTDEIICDAGANGTNSRVEVMQNVSKIS